MDGLVTLVVSPNSALPLLIAAIAMGVCGYVLSAKKPSADFQATALVVVALVIMTGTVIFGFLFSTPAGYDNPARYAADVENGVHNPGWLLEAETEIDPDKIEAFIEEHTEYDGVSVVGGEPTSNLFDYGSPISISVPDGNEYKLGTMYFTPDSFILTFPVMDKNTVDVQEYAL